LNRPAGHELAIVSDYINDDFAGVHRGQAIDIERELAAGETCRMRELASALGARVQGEEGEYYD